MEWWSARVIPNFKLKFNLKGYKNANLLYAVDSATDLFARKYIGRWFAVFIDLAGVSATFNVAMASFNMNTRVLFSLGREHVLGISID
jgi:amino acid transporter